ncbi:HlyC/CorC family transporter [archaeon]|nr:HlyC/CorC family transporter [archaeon]
MTPDNIIYIVLTSVSLVMLFILNLGEVAFIRMPDDTLEEDAEKGLYQAKKLKYYTENYRTFEIHKQMISVLILSLMMVIFYLLMTNIVINMWLVIVFIFVFYILYVILFNHLPKRLGIRFYHKLAYGSYIPYIIVFRLFYPITYIIYTVSKWIATLLQLNPELTDRDMTEEQIRSIVTESSQSGVLDEEESEMIHNVFDFDDTEVYEVMTHRVDIQGLEVSMSPEDIIKIIGDQRFTRYPVYQENLDTIIGTVHLKDFIPYLTGKRKTIRLKSFMRKPYFIPESQKISDLLKEMQQSKNHIAIVLDEYGGTSGLVTFEDIIEEIIGTVSDEFDDEDIEIHKISDRVYHILGDVNIYDVEDLLDASIDVEAYDTLSGFMLDQLGHLPEDQEVVEFVFNNIKFKSLIIEDQVFKKIEVTILEELDSDV